MRNFFALCLVASVAVAGCSGEIDGGDDGDGDGGNGGTDGTPVTGEPPGLEGITDAHNAVRAATGAGLTPLTWDPALAVIAKNWVEQCVDTQQPIGLVDHNAGRSDTYPGYVGENIYGSSGQTTGTAAVQSWASEEANYDYANNTCNGVCGHYTQIVWGTTTKVGCAIHDCSALRYRWTIVCNYAPGGNSGGRPY